MEKRYLEIFDSRGRFVGAFENVTNFQESDDGTSFSFACDDGSFTYTKDSAGVYSCDDNYITFSNYRLVGRRTLLRHVGGKDAGVSRPITHRINVDDSSDVQERDSCFTYDNCGHLIIGQY